jgi:hypothetical protein
VDGQPLAPAPSTKMECPTSNPPTDATWNQSNAARNVAQTQQPPNNDINLAQNGSSTTRRTMTRTQQHPNNNSNNRHRKCRKPNWAQRGQN